MQRVKLYRAASSSWNPGLLNRLLGSSGLRPEPAAWCVEDPAGSPATQFRMWRSLAGEPTPLPSLPRGYVFPSRPVLGQPSASSVSQALWDPGLQTCGSASSPTAQQNPDERPPVRRQGRALRFRLLRLFPVRSKPGFTSSAALTLPRGTRFLGHLLPGQGC